MALRRIALGIVALGSAWIAPAALAKEEGRPDARQRASSAGGVQLVRQPIAAYGREGGQPIYFVYLRLNRPVPRNSNDSPAAAVRLGGLGLSRPPTSSSMGFLSAPSSQGRYCYEQQLVLPQRPYPPIVASPRPGLRLSFELIVRGRDTPLTTTVALRRRAGPAAGARPYLRELRCVRSS